MHAQIRAARGDHDEGLLSQPGTVARRRMAHGAARALAGGTSVRPRGKTGPCSLLRPGLISMTSARVHIIGAGMAGLAAAVRLRHLGSQLTVYEAAPRAGGRCRSYMDPQLGVVIDNGNHLLLS